MKAITYFEVLYLLDLIPRTVTRLVIILIDSLERVFIKNIRSVKISSHLVFKQPISGSYSNNRLIAIIA